MIDSRRDLSQALAAAAEIEHAICCAYLYAAFSLKKSPDEGGVTQIQTKALRDWGQSLLAISKEEMKHLGIVENLLISIGGAPRLQRDRLPFPVNHFGQLPAINLERFGESALAMLIELEKPEPLHLQESIQRQIDDLPTQPPSFGQALEVVVGQLALDANWAYGEVWTRGESGTLRCVSPAWYPGTLANAEIRALRDRTIGLASRGAFREDNSLPGRTWEESFDPEHPPRVLAVGPDTVLADRLEALEAAGLNCAASVPIVARGETLAVMVFFFRLWFDPSDDDQTVKVVYDVVNAPHEDPEPTDPGVFGAPQPNSLGLTLARLAAAGPRADAAGGGGDPPPPAVDRSFCSLGGFYRRIQKGFEYLAHLHGEDKLFVGPAGQQVSLPTIEKRPFGLVPIFTLKAAREAIDEIIVEGEGTPTNPEESHFGRLLVMRAELAAERKADPKFEPARPVATNPVTDERRVTGGASGLTLIDNPLTADIARLANDAYGLLLMILMRLFARLDDDDRFDNLSYVVFRPMMTMLIRPLCEELTLLDAHPEPGERAGPTFELATDLQLLPHGDAFWVAVREALEVMAREARDFSKRSGAPERLAVIGRNMAKLATMLTPQHEAPS